MNFKTKENKFCLKFKPKNRNRSRYTDKLYPNGRLLYKKIKMKKAISKRIIMKKFKEFKLKSNQSKINILRSKHKRNRKKLYRALKSFKI